MDDFSNSLLVASLVAPDASPSAQFVNRRLHDAWLVNLLLMLTCFLLLVAGLAIVLCIRPADLLRWAPTGTAWWKYRAGYALEGAHTPLHALASFTHVEQYILAYDARDASAAEQLRQTLKAAGATETTTMSAEVVTVFLVTNHTQPVQMQQYLQQSQGRILTVVGTSISTSETSDVSKWLGRFQWVDFRRWEGRLTDREGALPMVPEAFARPRLPRRVSYTHHLLCLASVLLFELFFLADASLHSSVLQELNALMTRYGLSWYWPRYAILFTAIFGLKLGLAWYCARLASTFVHRVTTKQHWFRSLGLGGMVIILPGWWVLRDASITEKPGVAALVLVAVVAGVVHQRHAIAFWFPVFQGGQAQKSGHTPAGKWRTLTWFWIYYLAWAIVWDFGKIVAHMVSKLVA